MSPAKRDPRIKSAAGLAAWRDRLRAEGAPVAPGTAQPILVCFGGSCLASG
ncbi:MAG: hypothetical protein GX590_02775, partial [Lentisphaerae bacterium]|nr:hypothetical protein [Lentisphaerota bacterium]